MKFYRDGEYREKCEKLFHAYRAQILQVIPLARVEHIGASAVPGAISKGDLDIFVGVEREQHAEAVHTLIPLGFHVKQETFRSPELCMLCREVEDVALQVVASGSQFEFFLEFRDVLRKSPDVLDRYNRLKMACESLSAEEYRNVKSEFIESVLNVE